MSNSMRGLSNPLSKVALGFVVTLTCLGIFGPFITWKWPPVNWLEFWDHFDRQFSARQGAIYITYV